MNIVVKCIKKMAIPFSEYKPDTKTYEEKSVFNLVFASLVPEVRLEIRSLSPEQADKFGPGEEVELRFVPPLKEVPAEPKKKKE